MKPPPEKAAKASESGGGVTGQPLIAGKVVDPGADLLGQRAAFKTELPHLAGGGN
jgi:hypothetical protein